MKVEIDARNRGWQNAVFVILPLMVLFFYGLYAALRESDLLMVVAYSCAALLMAFLLYVLLDIRNYSCMSLVKNEMSYRELKDAIARENFEDPIDFLKHHSLNTFRFFVSSAWTLLCWGDSFDDPICIPKSKVRSIEVSAIDFADYEEELELDDDALLELGNKTYYGFELICDEEQSFPSGFIAPEDLDDALAVLRQHFPQAKLV